MIGIVDFEKQKERKRSYNSKNVVCYYAHNGDKYPCGGYEGDGIKVGETVEVRVDRTHGTVSWLVDHVERATHTAGLLCDKSRKFLPYVEMYNYGDTI